MLTILPQILLIGANNELYEKGVKQRPQVHPFYQNIQTICNFLGTSKHLCSMKYDQFLFFFSGRKRARMRGYQPLLAGL